MLLSAYAWRWLTVVTVCFHQVTYWFGLGAMRFWAMLFFLVTSLTCSLILSASSLSKKNQGSQLPLALNCNLQLLETSKLKTEQSTKESKPKKNWVEKNKWGLTMLEVWEGWKSWQMLWVPLPPPFLFPPVGITVQQRKAKSKKVRMDCLQQALFTAAHLTVLAAANVSFV